MENSWFYLDSGQRLGPVSMDELAGALSRAPEPLKVLVWREGFAEWREAGSFPEIIRILPPPGPMFYPQAVAPAIPFDQAENIARYYRRLVLLVGAQILLGFLRAPAAVASNSATTVLLLLSLVLLVVIAFALVVTAYQLAQHMGESVPIVWAIAMFVPCINILVLLILSSKAQSWCRRYGIPVGFLGPSKKSIEELRSRGMTSHFE